MKPQLYIPKDPSASPRSLAQRQAVSPYKSLSPFTLSPQQGCSYLNKPVLESDSERQSKILRTESCEAADNLDQYSQSIQVVADQWVARFQAGSATTRDLASSILTMISPSKRMLRNDCRKASPRSGSKGYSEMMRARTAYTSKPESLDTSVVSQKSGHRMVYSMKNSPAKIRTGAHCSPQQRAPHSQEKSLDIFRICLVSLHKSATQFSEAVDSLVKAENNAELTSLLSKVQTNLDFAAQILDETAQSHAVSSLIVGNVIETLSLDLEKERNRSERLLQTLSSAQSSAKADSFREKQVVSAMLATSAAQTESKLAEISFKLQLFEGKTAALKGILSKLAAKQRILKLKAVDTKLSFVSKELSRMKTFEMLYYRAQNTVFKLQKDLFALKRQKTEENLLEAEIKKLKNETLSVSLILDQKSTSEVTIERLKMTIEDLEIRLIASPISAILQSKSHKTSEFSCRTDLKSTSKWESPLFEGDCGTENRLRMIIEDFASSFPVLEQQKKKELRLLREKLDDLEAENSVLGCENSFLNKECDELRGVGSFYDFGKVLDIQDKPADTPQQWNELYWPNKENDEKEERVSVQSDDDLRAKDGGCSPQRPSRFNHQSETGKMRKLVADLQQATETLQRRLHERDPGYPLPAEVRSSGHAKYTRVKRTCNLLRTTCRRIAGRVAELKGKEADTFAVQSVIEEVGKIWAEIHYQQNASGSEWAQSLSIGKREDSFLGRLVESDFGLLSFSDSELQLDDSLCASLFSSQRVVGEARYQGKVWKLIKNDQNAYQWLPECEENLLEKANIERQLLAAQLEKAESRLRVLTEVELLAESLMSSPKALVPWLRELVAGRGEGDYWNTSEGQLSPPISTCAQSLKNASEPISRRSIELETQSRIAQLDVKTLCSELVSVRPTKDISSTMGSFMLLREAVLALKSSLPSRPKDAEALSSALCSYFCGSST